MKKKQPNLHQTIKQVLTLKVKNLLFSHWRELVVWVLICTEKLYAVLEDGFSLMIGSVGLFMS